MSQCLICVSQRLSAVSVGKRSERSAFGTEDAGQHTHEIIMCIQVDLDATDSLRHMAKNNSERPVCRTHPLAPNSTSLLLVFDIEWVISSIFWSLLPSLSFIAQH